jgi:type IV secretion system protein VirB10
VRAVTAEDIWSFDGRRVLIPAGTRLIGEYRSGLARGQTRIFVVWTRLLRSDGVSVALGSIGTDDLGRAGLTGTVDNKYLERFGSAILLSVVGGAAQFIAGLGNANQQTSGPIQVVDPVTGQVTIVQPQPNQLALNARQIGAQTTAQTLTQLAQEALRDQISIPPTVHVDQGARIMIFVRRDLDFSAVYPDPVKEEVRRLQAGGRSPPRFDPTLPPPGAPLSIVPPAATRITKP